MSIIVSLQQTCTVAKKGRAPCEARHFSERIPALLFGVNPDEA
jgi:hypothetical protein